MTGADLPSTSSSRLRQGLRLILLSTSAALAMGLALSLLLAGPAEQAATSLVWLGLGLLVIIPVLNVVAVLLDEWREPDRRFAAAAVVVLVLLAYTTASKLGLVAQLVRALQ
jgi:uncharacterized membrane protein